MENLLSGDNFYAFNPEKVLGTETTTSSRFGPQMYTVVGDAQAGLQSLPVADAPRRYNTGAGPVDNIRVVAPRPLPAANEANLEKAIAKTEKANRARKTGSTPPGGELLTFEEVFAAYNPGITEEEVRVWVWYQCRPGGWMNRAHISQPGNGWGKYLVQNPDLKAWHRAGLVAWDGAGYVPSVLYYGGDVLAKIRKAKSKPADFLKEITQTDLDAQLARLEASRPKEMVLLNADDSNRLLLDPRSEFCQKQGLSALFTEYLKKVSGVEVKAAYGVTGEDVRNAMSQSKPRSRKSDAPISPDQKAKLHGASEAALRDLFGEFLKTMDDERLVQIQTAWNEQYNRVVQYDYSKVPIGFTAGRVFKKADLFVRPAQREAVAFLSVEGSGIVGYDVGVGKTMSAILYISQAMYAGMMNRPLLVVPKNVYKKWCNEIRGTENRDGEKIAGILPQVPLVELGNLNKEYLGMLPVEGKKFVFPEQCIFIATVEGMENIGFTDQTGEELVEFMGAVLKQNYNQEGQLVTRKSLRDAAKFKEGIYSVIYDSLEGTVLNIEILGADGLITDETHLYKNLFPTVAGKIKEVEIDDDGNEKIVREVTPFQIKGSIPSGRAIKAFLLGYYISGRNQNRNIIGLTATPFNNSPLEIYSMLALVAFRTLKDMGIENIIAFFEQFVDETVEMAINTRGEPVSKAIIKSYRNLPVLQSIIFKYLNYKTGEDANIERPEKLVLPILQAGGKPLPEAEQVPTLLPPTTLQLMLLKELQALGLSRGSVFDYFVNREEKSGRVYAADLLCVAFSRQIAISPFLSSTAFLPSVMDWLDDKWEGYELLADGEIDEDGFTAGYDRYEIAHMPSLTESEKRGDWKFQFWAAVRSLGRIRKEMRTVLGAANARVRGVSAVPAKILIETSPKLMYVTSCIASVIEYHRRNNEPLSGQVIYMGQGIDIFPAIRDYLVDKGVFKENQVGFIHGKVAQDARERIKEDFLDPQGKTRLIIGSDAILVGVDLQNQSSCLYNVTLPWNPTDLRQVEGRIWRFGNIYQWVRIVNPIVENTSDAFQYQLLYEKGARINSVLSRQGQAVFDVEDIDFAEMRDQIITDPGIRAIRAQNKERDSLQIELDGMAQAVQELESAKINSGNYVRLRGEVDSFISQQLMQIAPEDLAEVKPDSIVSIKAAIRKNLMAKNRGYIYDSWERGVYLPFQAAKDWIGRRILSEKKRLERQGVTDMNNINDAYILAQIDSNTLGALKTREKEVKDRIEYINSSEYLLEMTEVFAEDQRRKATKSRTMPALLAAFARTNHLLSCTSITGKLCDVKGIVGSVPKQKQVVVPMPAAQPDNSRSTENRGQRTEKQPTATPDSRLQTPAPTVAQLTARLNIVALALELEDDPAAVKQLTARKNILELAIELA